MTRPSFSHGTSDLPLLGETIGQNLRRAATVCAHREALVDVPSGRRWTYREFDEEVGTLARGTSRWMHTGDLATMDEAGYVNIVGRIKDIVIRGGENLYPREIEEFLYGHPEIEDVQVIGVPDAKYGEELCAWIKPRAGSVLTEESVRDYCRGRLSHHKIPRYIRFTDGFPMTVTGKIQKFKMRETSIKELGLEDAAATETA